MINDSTEKKTPDERTDIDFSLSTTILRKTNFRDLIADSAGASVRINKIFQHRAYASPFYRLLRAILHFRKRRTYLLLFTPLRVSSLAFLPSRLISPSHRRSPGNKHPRRDGPARKPPRRIVSWIFHGSFRRPLDPPSLPSRASRHTYIRVGMSGRGDPFVAGK